MNAAYQKLVDNDRDKAVTYTENAKAILNGEGRSDARHSRDSYKEKEFLGQTF